MRSQKLRFQLFFYLVSLSAIVLAALLSGALSGKGHKAVAGVACTSLIVSSLLINRSSPSASPKKLLFAAFLANFAASFAGILLAQIQF